MSHSDRYRLDQMSWPEVRDALSQDTDIVILPVGALEEHGPHMGLITDSLLVTTMADQAAREVPGVLVAPTIVYGISHHHMDFPGTATLKPDTLKNVIIEVGSSLLRHGFKLLVLLNGHGGNNGTVAVAAMELREETGKIVANIFAPALARETYKKLNIAMGGHADEAETSLMLAAAPDLVKMDLAVREYPRSVPPFDFTGKSLTSLLAELGLPRTLDFTESGTLGDATLASPEIGRQLMEASIENLIGVLRELQSGIRSRPQRK